MNAKGTATRPKQQMHSLMLCTNLSQRRRSFELALLECVIQSSRSLPVGDVSLSRKLRTVPPLHYWTKRDLGL